MATAKGTSSVSASTRSDCTTVTMAISARLSAVRDSTKLRCPGDAASRAVRRSKTKTRSSRAAPGRKIATIATLSTTRLNGHVAAARSISGLRPAPMPIPMVRKHKSRRMSGTCVRSPATLASVTSAAGPVR